ncbi:MAG TPA: glycosyltransferase family 4 protein [Acidimicrobiales bacterium]|jgi:glycosyltransferase involved in cell wall biosynthesis
MRVLIVHEGYFPALAGAETMAWRAATGLATRGHEVAVLGAPTAPVATVDGVHVVTDPLALPWVPDVVHAVDLVSRTYALLAAEVADRAGSPLAVTPASAPEVWQDREAGMDVCRRADVVFVLTGAEGSVFRAAGVAAERLLAVGQGPEIEGRPDPDAFRAATGVDGPFVLYLGRKARFKGFHRVLAAAPLVWERRPDAAFVFAGPDWDPDAKDVMAASADPRVVDLGVVDGATKRDALAACSLLCLPSTADVFPLVFVEAWTCGRPVVSGDFPGATEVVRHGLDGLVVPVDPAPLAEAVADLLCDDARRVAMGEAGRRRAEQDLTWDAVTDRIEAAYRRLRAPVGAGDPT